MPKKITHEEFEQRVYDAVGDGYTALSKYITAMGYVLMKHNECGHEWKITPNNFVNIGQRCPHCANRKTHEEFEQRVYDAVGNEYTVLGKYITANKHILMKHNKCGHEWKITPSSFINKGTRCPKCALKKSRKTHEEFIKEVYDAVGNEYTVLGKYISSSVHILMKHNKCGHEWKIRATSFINTKHRCPKCINYDGGNGHLKSTEKYKEDLRSLHGNKIKVMSEYTGSRNPIDLKCNKCGHEWTVKASAALRGISTGKAKYKGCPECRKNKKREDGNNA